MAGYDGYSKSNNAVDAEENGRFPITKAKRIVSAKTGITQKTARKVLKSLGTSEYHHTSKYYNTTDYYDTELAVRIINECHKVGIIAYQDMLDKWYDCEDIDDFPFFLRGEKTPSQIGAEEYERDQKLKRMCVHDFELRYRDAKVGRVPSHYKCRICDAIKEL